MTTRVLVTGGSGFIGTWVLRELIQRDATPVVYDLTESRERWQRILGGDADAVRFVQGDLTDRSALHQAVQQHSITHVIHLGALLTPDCQDNPWVGCQVNVLGSVAIFEAVRANAGQIHGVAYASSLAVFGPEQDDVVSTASQVDTTNAPSFYGAFKRSVELIANQYWKHYQIPSVGIRPHVVYGPERTVGLTAGPSLAARAAALNEAFTINYTGEAGYDYVEDVARGFVRSALETPAGAHVVDLPSQAATPERIVQHIDEIAPGSARQLSVSGPSIPSNMPSHRTLISELFPDWQATSLENGLRQTIEFYH